MSKSQIIVVVSLSLLLILAFAKITIEGERAWTKFKAEHHCENTSQSRNRIISVKPPLLAKEYLWRCDNGEYWGR